MWNETNPTSLYLGTTWELISAGKYIKTGSTALQNGGTNSISIQKANLPNIKLKVDSFSLITQAHNHTIYGYYSRNDAVFHNTRGGFAFGVDADYTKEKSNNACLNGGGNSTGTSSPNTEVLGNGTALSIQPEYITLKCWKRTS